MTVPDAKSHPQLRRYQLRRLRLPLASGFLDLVVPDAREWLRGGLWAANARVGSPEPPYWVEIWPASVAVARFLAKVGSLAGVRVLDLGCGLGVPGIAAASRGALVTFADRQPDALAFAGWNAQRAHPEGLAATCVQFDWSSGVVPGQCDILVMADVTYRPAHHRPILQQVAAGLAPDGLIVHADPLRRESDDFLKELRRDFETKEWQQVTTLRDRKVTVRLCCATRSPTRWSPAVFRAPGESPAPTTGKLPAP